MKWLLLPASILFALLWGGAKLVPVWLDRAGTRPLLPASHTARESLDKASVPPPPEIPRLPPAIDFATQIVPVLQRRCTGCHPGTAANEPTHAQLARLASLLNAADAACHCLHVVVSRDDADTRAAGGTLTRPEAEILAQWVDEGAYCPAPQPEDAGDGTDAERQHWAWQPLRPPPVPRADSGGWSRNPIDAFVVSRLAQQGRTPVPSADAATLVRRLALAVTGLPPSPQDLLRLAAAGPREIDSYVDELLASPAYGEHWARYWLDLVRYADTNGYEDDGLKPLAWKYRDFVIRSLNEDRPYDQFVRMQLAGDLSPQPTADDYIAVGFLRLGAWNSEPDDALLDRYDQLDDMVSTTGLVFLGMTIGCARCHDHPDEPVTAVDYARLVGCFHGLGRPTQGRLENACVSATRQQIADAATARQRQQQLRLRAFSAEAPQAAALRREAARLEDDVRFEQAYRFAETGLSREPTRLLRRGDPHHPGEFVTAGVPAVLADRPFQEGPLPRRQLADWLVSTGHALSARLIVNRVWAWHFGVGLVETPSNLGRSGARPTHPELLEWLSAWFVNEANWSLKALQRLILTSRTFRTQIDPGDNPDLHLYGSFPPRRLRAEVLQDAMLTVAGLQDRSLYGPPVFDQPSDQPAPATVSAHPPGEFFPLRRRAVYAAVTRSAPDAFLATFDLSRSAVSCSGRRTTHTAQQALTLWNGPLVQRCAAALAQQILEGAPGSGSRQVETAFLRITGHIPDEFERDRSLQFLDQQIQATGSESAALGRLCLVLFNSDEFVFLD